MLEASRPATASGPRDRSPAVGGVFDALLAAARRYGGSKLVLEDQERRPLSYTDVIRASFALARKLAPLTSPGEHVGVLLPSSVGASVTFLALQAGGRVPAMLNFTAGLRNLRAAVRLANVKRVLTSHRFVEQGKLHDVVDALEATCEITYLEDVRRTIGLGDRLYALAASLAPQRFRAHVRGGDPAVILFTSGSFGAPRGVVLSHTNILANVDQVARHIALDPDWVMFNPLPVFHCFGLTGGVMLPLLTGMKAFQYPSPLHVKVIPPLIKATGASILLATDTFVNQYARSAEPEALSGLRFIVCGAEKVRDETHNLITERFGNVPVLEGYGATEASPVIAVNKPEDNRKGTVGALLPDIETRLEPVEGIDRGGRLLVKGPNIMSGYLVDGGVEPPPGGWHDTGDVVEMTNDGWISILGRVKRFAKIGGEMVSMTAAEQLASQLWPNARHAVIAVADPRKGERLVLVTDQADAEVGPLLAHAQRVGAPELAAPRKIVRAPEIPVLGSGKTDYVAIQRIAETEAHAG
ncbi:MAG TPA: AMP-binding protein [Caulobacteraceae bacterium]|nr:AMP-binding protein [Caulobacteraceae bacterium]